MGKKNMDEFAAGVKRSDLGLNGLFCPVGEHDFDWLKDFMDDKFPPIKEDPYKHERIVNTLIYWGNPQDFNRERIESKENFEELRQRIADIFHVSLEDAFRVYWGFGGYEAQEIVDALVRNAIDRKLPQILPEALIPEYEKRVSEK